MGKDAVAYCDLSYAPYYFIEDALNAAGADHSQNLKQSSPLTNQFGIAFVKDDRAWFVFRGSDVGDDWALNFNLLPFPQWHFGFLLAWKDLKESVMKFASDHAKEVNSFFITGHSLGGAIATHAAHSLAKAGYEVEAVKTFGSPRVFSVPGSIWYNMTACNFDGLKLGDVTERYVVPIDPIPGMPSFVLGFRHSGFKTEPDRKNKTSSFDSVGYEKTSVVISSPSKWSRTLKKLPYTHKYEEFAASLSFGLSPLFIATVRKAAETWLNAEHGHVMSSYRAYFGDSSSPFCVTDKLKMEARCTPKKSRWFSRIYAALTLLGLLLALGFALKYLFAGMWVQFLIGALFTIAILVIIPYFTENQ